MSGVIERIKFHVRAYQYYWRLMTRLALQPEVTEAMKGMKFRERKQFLIQTTREIHHEIVHGEIEENYVTVHHGDGSKSYERKNDAA